MYSIGVVDILLNVDTLYNLFSSDVISYLSLLWIEEQTNDITWEKII